MTCHLINKAVTIITIGIITFKIFFDPVTQFPGNEKIRCAIQKVQKSSWSEPYSSSSFTKQSCSKMALYV